MSEALVDSEGKNFRLINQANNQPPYQMTENIMIFESENQLGLMVMAAYLFHANPRKAFAA